MIRALTIQEIELIAFEVARKHLTWNEPIPNFSTRYPDRLESCIATPFGGTADGKSFYTTLTAKAAILFYLLNKNHPFVNGNKRIAVTSLLTFLHTNRKWIRTTPDGLYHLSVLVAESRSEQKEFIVGLIDAFIIHYLIDA